MVDLYVNSGESATEVQEIAEVVYEAVNKEFVGGRKLKSIL